MVEVAVRSIPLVACLSLVPACTGTIESPVWGPSNSDRPGFDPATDDSSGAGASNGSLPGGRSPRGSQGALPDEGGGPGSADGTDPGSTAPGEGDDAVDACATRVVGSSPMRRLSRSEFDNAVRDLLGDTTQPARAFVADTQVGLFDNTASTQTIPTLLAEQYLDAAVELADNVQDVAQLAGCDPASGEDCVRDFIARFGRRAFRRPLSEAESTRLSALYSDTLESSDAATGVRAVVAAVLASPNFLFRQEIGLDAPSDIAGARRLTAYELSARMAGLIWASVPDDELLDAAAAGALETKADVEREARRMLEDERARPALAQFYAQWFGLERIESASKDPEVYPQFDAALRSAMGEESRRFIDDVLWNGDARLETLLTASYSFVNQPLAEIYGVEGPSEASAFSRVELDPDQRAGVLTQASVLAGYARPDQSSPVKRGQWVRVRLLCQELPDPPANIPELPPPAEGVSNRERFAMHTSNPACSGCHNLIDGLGFGLEAYDGLGRFRTLDQGVAVDSSGEITSTTDIDGEYDGAVELAAQLARSNQVRDCAPTQWLRYTLGREAEAGDSCSSQELKRAFAASGGDLRELMLALTQTDAFWHYQPGES